MTDTSKPISMTRAELVAMIADHTWYFAKTMADNPHEYTLRHSKGWRVGWDDDEAFDKFVAWIRQAGLGEKYQGYWYTVWYFEDFKYWSMGAPIAETILVNRKHRAFYAEDYGDSTAGSVSGDLRQLLEKRGTAHGGGAG